MKPEASGPAGGSGPSDRFTVLTVCTGNICRSPAAERMLAAVLGPSVEVSSAGTYAMRGAPVAPAMAHLLEAGSVSSAGFAARQLTPALLRPAGLVLTMTREHRSAVVDLWPAAVRRTFTLREFARLLVQVEPGALPTGSPGRRLAAAVPQALVRRGLVTIRAEEDGVVDPYGADDHVYLQSYNVIRAAVERMGRIVVDPSTETSGPAGQQIIERTRQGGA